MDLIDNIHGLCFLFCLALIPSILSYSTATSDTLVSKQVRTETISKVVMNLSAFGVESDDFPSINATLDFVRNFSECTKTYYNPAAKGSTYHLSNTEIAKVLSLLQKVDLEKLEKHYHTSKTDQPTSTTTIYIKGKTYVVEDYGLIGRYPLQKLYQIVYKL